MSKAKDPIQDLSAATDNVLRPWARNPETDLKLDNAINGLNNILQMSAPQKFSGKQGYSALDRTPDRIIALYEFARSNPDWVDSFLDGVPPTDVNRGAVLESMDSSLYHDNNYYQTGTGAGAGAGEESDLDSEAEYYEAEEGDDYDHALLGDVDVLEATFGLGQLTQGLGPEFDATFLNDKYLPNGQPRYESDAVKRHSCYGRTRKLNKILRRKEDRQLAPPEFVGRYRLSTVQGNTGANATIQSQSQRQRRRRRRKTTRNNQTGDVVSAAMLCYAML
jgi:hypothetical protein